MKLINQLENITRFTLTANDCYYTTKAGMICNKNVKKKISVEHVNNIFAHNNKIYLNDIYGNHIIFDMDLNIIDEAKKQMYFPSSNFYVLLLTIGEDERYYSLISNDNDEIDFENIPLANNENLTTKNCYYAHFKNNELRAFNLPDKSLKWIFSFSDLKTWLNGAIPEIQKLTQIIGLYDNKLVCALNSGDLVVINTDSGKVNFVINKETKIPFTNFKYNVSQSSENSPIFWSFWLNAFTEFDIEKGVITRQLNIQEKLFVKLKELIPKLHNKLVDVVLIDNSFVHKERIYFSANKKVVGIFNPKTEEFDWVYYFPFKNEFISLNSEVIQANNSYFYVLSDKYNLYVFEIKDENNE